MLNPCLIFLSFSSTWSSWRKILLEIRTSPLPLDEMIAQALLGLLNILNKILAFKGNVEEIIVLISTEPPFKRWAAPMHNGIL